MGGGRRMYGVGGVGGQAAVRRGRGGGVGGCMEGGGVEGGEGPL